ncbi:MAG: hypothetical protein IPP73_02570 [Chitinophagaceae bacterium]|nr:hypothetical protein [Chitinophagaceae bacterium]
MVKYFSYLGITALAFLLVLTNQSGEKTTTPNCCQSHWKGWVRIEDIPGTDNGYMLPESNFIRGGTAHLTQRFGGYYRYWVGLEYEIPCDKNINGDQCKMEWYGKSDLGISLYESDHGATFGGYKDSATVNCITVNRPPYFIFRYGKVNLDDVPELVNNPSGWAKYTIETDNGTLRFYKNDKLLKEMKTSSSIGQLKTIYIHFKGGGRVDWVKLYEKSKLVMEEKFSVNGVTGAKWYK